MCPLSGFLTAYSPDGNPVQTHTHHHSSICCADAPRSTLDTTVVTATENAKMFSGTAGAYILSDCDIFNTNLLSSFQRIITPKLPCLSYFSLFSSLLEWNGGVTGGHNSSQQHPLRQSLTPITSVSDVDMINQCSALMQAPSERPRTVHAPFDLTLTFTGYVLTLLPLDTCPLIGTTSLPIRPLRIKNTRVLLQV